MTFSRGFPSGIGFHTKITSAGEELADSQWPAAVDGLNGGLYTLANDLTFTSASTAILYLNTIGVSFAGQAAFNSDVNIVGTGSFGFSSTGTFAVSAGTAVFGGGIEIANTVAVYYALHVDGDATFVHGLTANGASPSLFTAGITVTSGITADNVTVSSNFAVAGTLAIASGPQTTTIAGTVNIASLSTLNFLGTGHARKRIETNLDSGSSGTPLIIGPGDGADASADYFVPGSITANRTWRLAAGVNGDEVFVSLVRTSGSFGVTIQRPDSSVLIGMFNAGVAGYYAHFVFNNASGGWFIMDDVVFGSH